LIIFPSRAGWIGRSLSSRLEGNRRNRERDACGLKAPLKDRVNGPSTTTRNQINENSPVDANFLGGSPVVYCVGLGVIRTANTTKIAGVLNGTA
jgi:hypothetical protein